MRVRVDRSFVLQVNIWIEALQPISEHRRTFKSINCFVVFIKIN